MGSIFEWVQLHWVAVAIGAAGALAAQAIFGAVRRAQERARQWQMMAPPPPEPVDPQTAARIAARQAKLEQINARLDQLPPGQELPEAEAATLRREFEAI